MARRKKTPTLNEYAAARAEEVGALGRLRTAEAYICAVKKFDTLMGCVRLGDIRPGIVATFIERLRASGLAPNTVDFHVRTVRALYNHAVLMEIIEDARPFDKNRTHSEETAKRALTPEQLKQLIDVRDLDSRTAKARDMWLLSFLLNGISPVDLGRLTPGNIEGDRIVYRRSKTRKRISIKFTPHAQAIVAMYPGKDGKLVDFNYDVTNYWLKKVGAAIDLPFGLTLYCARHTFATSLHRIDAPIGVISQTLGHSDTEVTRIYLDSIGTVVVDRWCNEMLNNVFKRE